MHILLVEDDTLLGEGLFTGLKRQQHHVDWVKNGETALDAWQGAAYDLMILDLGLPKMSGLEVLARIRAGGSEIPVLILTARDAIDDRVAGLDAGADDYMVKPFEFDELCARIRALGRRAARNIVEVIRYGDIELNKTAHSVHRGGEKVELSRNEFILLEHLLSSAGKVFSKAALEQRLYSWTNEVGSNTVEVYIHFLRKKLGAGLIRTIRGVGYTIADENQAREDAVE